MDKYVRKGAVSRLAWSPPPYARGSRHRPLVRGRQSGGEIVTRLIFARDAKIIDRCKQYLAMYELKLSSLI